MPLYIADVTNAPDVENPYTFPLDPFQKCAVQAINDHQHVLVTAKTGSGKTLVGEYQIKVSLAKGKRVFYTTPIKSLSNQKFHDLKEMGLSVGILTGDIKFAPQSDVVVMTTEILCNLLFKQGTPSENLIDLSLHNVDAIVFDEVHYINDPDRGKVWEQCIMLLPLHINLVMLSATMSEADKFARWISSVKNDAPIHLISTQYRVVPLLHIVGKRKEVVMDSKDVFHADAYNRWLHHLDDLRQKEKEHRRRVANRGEEPIAKESRIFSFVHQMNETIKEIDLPALFFVFSRQKCEDYASKITENLLTSSESAEVRHIMSFHLHRYPDILTSQQYHKLLALLEKGIAFHHSGLLPVLKEIVEILFSKGFVKLLFATETFAVGINMPTKTVVFTSYQKHDGNTLRMLKTSEYIQMAGRAGRRGKDDVGYVLYLPDRDPSTLDDVRRMMTGGSIRVSSQMDFGYDFLIKTFYGKDLDWKEIARNTYWYQQRQEGLTRLKKDLQKLEEERDRFDMTPAIVDDLTKKTTLEKEFRESVNAKRKDAQRKLEQWKNTHMGPRWDQLSKSFVRFTEINKEIANVTEDIDACVHFEKEIEPRLEFLRTHHYLEEPLGRYAANIHEGNPLLMSFAFHHKILHTLPLEQLMGCLTLFSEDEGELSIFDCEQISENTLDCIETLSMEKHLFTTLNFEWVDVAIRWVSGEEAVSICRDYQIYEGNFIRAMLKLANIADEWTTMATASSDLEQLELLRDIRQKIVRGIVVPDSLYLRI